MKTILIILALCAALMVGCQQVTTPVEPLPRACTEEAKICPDGSSVGRTGPNCEFAECPAMPPVVNQTMEPDTRDRRWVQYDRTTCAATTWICPNGTEQFFDDSGCGCEAPEPRSYTSNDTEACKLMLFLCVAPGMPFVDETGCGCGFNWPDDYVNASSTGKPVDQKLQAIDCTDPRPEACTMDYNPVCGQVQVQCITAPCNPVKETFSNGCGACSNPNVISYTMGAC